jgi:hypothetical protein
MGFGLRSVSVLPLRLLRLISSGQLFWKTLKTKNTTENPMNRDLFDLLMFSKGGSPFFKKPLSVK